MPWIEQLILMCFLNFQTPEGWSSAADYSACEHIGYMLDGGKLYGYCEIDGVPVTSCYVQNSASTPTNEADYDYTPGKNKLIAALILTRPSTNHKNHYRLNASQILKHVWVKVEVL